MRTTDTDTEPPLRRPRSDEVDALAELHALSWQVTYGPLLAPHERPLLTASDRRRLWVRVLGEPRPNETCWVAEAGDRVVGLVFAGPSHDPNAASDVGEIHAIHVQPGLHGRGIGGRLLDAALLDLRTNGFRRATLWVIRENDEARRFYERHGWRPDGLTKHGPMGGFAGLPPVHELRYARSLVEERSPA
jgi:GNAT superfamily N-acetyltransferase